MTPTEFDAEQSADLLASALDTWGIALTPLQYDQFRIYAAMLLDWNATRINLTRLVTPEQVAILHFLDSLAPTQFLTVPRSAALLDIGTGAGFPGLAFKILRPDVRVTLLEATAKKLVFCRAVADALELADMETVHGRAEDWPGPGGRRDAFDVVTARAVAPLTKLLGWGVPFLKGPGASFIAWKGARAAEEMRDAQERARALGVTMRLSTVALPDVDGQATEHHYVVCPAAELDRQDVQLAHISETDAFAVRCPLNVHREVRIAASLRESSDLLHPASIHMADKDLNEIPGIRVQSKRQRIQE